VLEQLETEFYKEALSKFKSSDFQNVGFKSGDVAVSEITIIQQDEATHVSAIEDILIAFGEKPPSGCSFDFSSVLGDPATFLATARVVEDVGVGAYLGAAHLIQDLNVLTSAASIVTIESRHQTLLNIFSSATTISQAFDIPLLPQEVLAIAGSFIKGCSLGVTPNPSLAVTNTGTVTTGTSLQFKSSALNSSTSGFHCQMLTGGLPFSISLPIDKCVVPQGINGQVAIFITSDDQPLNGNAVQRQSNAIVAGPLLTFIDVQSDQLSESIRSKSSSSSSGDSKGSDSGYDQGSSSSSSMGSMGSNGASSFASTTTVPASQASSFVSSLSASASPAPTGQAGAIANGISPSPSASPAAGAIANGVSMIPKPTASA